MTHLSNPLRVYSKCILFIAAISTASCAVDLPQRGVQADPGNASQSNAMVVTANPLATEAGVDVLESGGSAADAAVAIAAVLSLVEPQSSGLGGGGFLVHYNARNGEVEVYDGRETAPRGATPEMFLDENGEPLSFVDAKNSGLSIGVPGMVSLLSLVQKDHGEKNWSELFDSASRLARDGFAVSPRLMNYLERFAKHFSSQTELGPTDAYNYFYKADGTPRIWLTNAPYSDTIASISSNPNHFYTGDIAGQIVAAANALPRAGSLTLTDMANYRARKHSPLCFDYKTYRLCGPPPPSSWVAVAMTMGILETSPRFLEQRGDYKDWAMLGEAMRLAYADRDHYVADTDFINVPLDGLLNKDYLATRAALIDPDISDPTVTHGDPWAFDNAGSTASRLGQDATLDYAGTTHFTVIDKAGNVVSMTASVESVFGSTRMAGGMILNNQLTDFSRVPLDASGLPIANAAAPLKRPRSSMSPTIVLDQEGRFLLSTGSPGGNSIIAYTLKTLVATLDWGLPPQAAIDLPNMVARGDSVRIESERASRDLIDSLREYGMEVKESAGENSGLNVIKRNPDGSLEGGTDPRREGTIGVPRN